MTGMSTGQLSEQAKRIAELEAQLTSTRADADDEHQWVVHWQDRATEAEAELAKYSKEHCACVPNEDGDDFDVWCMPHAILRDELAALRERIEAYENYYPDLANWKPEGRDE